MSIKTVIHTIRHAETTYGEESRYAGTMDVPLNEKGRRDALAAVEKLPEKDFDVVITSSKKRAIETASLLLKGNIPLIQTGLCDERNYGEMEGKTWDEVKTMDPPILFIPVGNDTHSVNPPRGEPFEDLRERAKKFRQFIFDNHEGSNILVVSHGVFLQQFHGLLRGLSCIESLAAGVRKLEYNSFYFQDRKLVKETSRQLSSLKRGAF
ncbi:MAG: histidine phosphatase family protein [Candidatus Krumholzibacteriota bacterium]|nr:histidine phosphatase family protein [Candidatus Krumholzibacteriota bacterium]